LDDKESRPGICTRHRGKAGWYKAATSRRRSINPFKAIHRRHERLALAITGRALGHRVWQSIEYYMANYPDVRAALAEKRRTLETHKAMHIAFEDQLVQKVMPKLRGIDTRGKSKSGMPRQNPRADRRRHQRQFGSTLPRTSTSPATSATVSSSGSPQTI
jgi:hypothetical protein